MAKVVCKGSVLQQTISSTLTDVAQVLSFELSGVEAETFDATTLDTSGAGKEYLATGYAEGGSVSGELFYDPALAGHQAITDDITTPIERAWNITFADSGATDMAFTVAGSGFDISVDMNDGLKSSFSLKLDQLPTFPT